ncbi:hypothetical protein C8R46DRAFT_1104607 [Mycena filopes]|nr:hypothetical protein C8R46DRAFT_1104607 [Mycena filopes]
MSRPPSAMSIQSLADDPGLDFDSEFPDPDGLLAISRVDPRSATPAYIPDIVPHPVPVHNSMRKGKGAKTSTGKFSITRQQRVDEIIDSSTVEATWTVPRTSVAIRVDLSQSREKLTLPNGNILPLDAFIRAEDQDSWGGSSGHTAGDAHARGFFPDDFEKTVWCRRCQFPCNGVDACELLDPEIFAGCERFEPDKAGMQELWRHELDSNEREAESVVGILTRFYTRIMNSKCKKKGCSGVATLLKLSKPYSGKTAFVGCSKWSRTEKNNHIYWPIPDNVDEGDLRFVMENNGLLPPNRQTPDANETCVLTVHPRIALGNCRFSHVVGGRIIPARMTRRECPTEMIIFIPVDDAPATRNKAIVILRNAHNHPMHPKIKPSNEDRIKLGAAVQAVGLTGLTAMKLLNAPSTSTIYAGARVAEHSPAFASARKVRDFISGEKKNAIPQGMEWEGVLYRMSKHEIKLPKSEQYIHTAMSKGGFKLVVTMHPQIAMYIHRVLYLVIDYTSS